MVLRRPDAQQKVQQLEQRVHARYVRESDLEEVMAALPEDHIPQHLTKRFLQEAEDKKRLQYERSEAHKFMEVLIATDDSLARTEKCSTKHDFCALRQYEPLKVKKTCRVWELLLELEKKYKIPIDQLRVWIIDNRQNGTRVTDPLTAEKLADHISKQKESKDNLFRFYVQDLGPERNEQFDNKLIHDIRRYTCRRLLSR